MTSLSLDYLHVLTVARQAARAEMLRTDDLWGRYIVELHEGGLSLRLIAKHAGVSAMRVRQVIAREHRRREP